MRASRRLSRSLLPLLPCRRCLSNLTSFTGVARHSARGAAAAAVTGVVVVGGAREFHSVGGSDGGKNDNNNNNNSSESNASRGVGPSGTSDSATANMSTTHDAFSTPPPTTPSPHSHHHRRRGNGNPRDKSTCSSSSSSANSANHSHKQSNGTLHHPSSPSSPPPPPPTSKQPASRTRMSAADCVGEDALMQLLKELGLELPTISHEEKHTVEEANKELARFGVPCTGTKNMFLKSKKGELVLVTALHTTETPIKTCQAAAGVKELRFAPAEVLKENLGVVQGSVTPLALVNNVDKRNVTVLLDKNLSTTPHPFVLHPCRNDKSTLLTFAQLDAILSKLGYTYKLVDFDADAPAAAPAAAAPAAKAKPAKPAKEPKAAAAAAAKNEAGETKLGLTTTRAENFADWYTEVVVKGELIEYYDVSGCYIIRPTAYFIWKCVQEFLGGNIQRLGVEDCYFPMFVSKSCLEREKDHVEGFAPEVAWVTRAGETDLEKPIAIRPTSETVMYPYYAKWIRSHRDLPLRLNQWNNVIRWEFSNPTPFIRTREFLWQEGHCAYATEEECTREVLLYLEEYARVYEELLAVPVIRGRKTEKEKFAGGYFTTTVETYIPAVGRGCQGGTSHNLGQNFGKMFDISYQDPAGTKDPETGKTRTLIPWQNSWGLTTRVLGVMIMVHGDDRGLVLPPRVASVQAVIIPVGITANTSAEERERLLDACKQLEGELRAAGVRARADLRDNYTPAWRFNDAELKGVPLRIEVGPKELAKRTLSVVVRLDGERRPLAWDDGVGRATAELLEDIYRRMYQRALKERDEGLVTVTQWADFVPALNQKKIIMAPWCGSMDCEDAVKKDSAEESKALLASQAAEDARAPSMGAKSLCIPAAQPPNIEAHTCICKSCTKKAETWVVFGRSY